MSSMVLGCSLCVRKVIERVLNAGRGGPLASFPMQMCASPALAVTAPMCLRAALATPGLSAPLKALKRSKLTSGCGAG